MSVEQVEREAFRLTQSERAVLAKRLLESLSDTADDASDLLWAEETVRRYEEFKRDKTKGILAATVFAKLNLQ